MTGRRLARTAGRWFRGPARPGRILRPRRLHSEIQLRPRGGAR